MKKKSQKQLALFLTTWFLMSGATFAATYTDTVTTCPIEDNSVITVDAKPGIEPNASDIDTGKGITITMTGADNELGAINANGKTITIGDGLKINASAIASPVGTFSAIGVKSVGTDSVINMGSANITTGTNALAIYAKGDGVINGSGIYNIKGNIIADDNGIINLTFESGSSLVGKIQSINDNAIGTKTKLDVTFNDSTIEGTIAGSSVTTTLNNTY